MTASALLPRIYVASLSDYNNGRLHGAWIDLAGKEESDVWQEINAILKASKYPNVMRQDCECKSCGHTWTRDVHELGTVKCPECLEDDAEEITCGVPYPSAEEWAIHDFEDFGELKPGEYTAIADIVKIAEAIDQFDDNGEAFTVFASNRGEGYLDDAIENFEEAYQGEWDSEREYAENLLDDLGELDKIPEHLRYYFDYDAYTRDLFINDYFSERLSNGNVAVFRRDV